MKKELFVINGYERQIEACRHTSKALKGVLVVLMLVPFFWSVPS